MINRHEERTHGLHEERESTPQRITHTLSNNHICCGCPAVQSFRRTESPCIAPVGPLCPGLYYARSNLGLLADSHLKIALAGWRQARRKLQGHRVVAVAVNRTEADAADSCAAFETIGSYSSERFVGHRYRITILGDRKSAPRRVRQGLRAGLPRTGPRCED